MRLLVIIFLITNIYAKDKNIFLDTKLDIPFFGKGIDNDGYGSSKSLYYTSNAFLGVSLGYSIKLHNEWVFEPSIGYTFSADDSLSFFDGKTFTYNYSDITLPFMYKKKGFKGGLFFRYINIDTIEWGDKEYDESDMKFKNKNPYTLGLKVVTRSWFYTYEYLFNGKYSRDEGRANVDIEGSRISIGLRVSF